MPLYRSCYYKDARMRGQTFWAETAADAAIFAEEILEPLFGTPMLTTKQIPSRAPAGRQPRPTQSRLDLREGPCT
jgi:hypothetical protein